MNEVDCYPQNNTDLKTMNRLLRHRLRNLCAGVTMTVDRIVQLAEHNHPDLAGRCDIVKIEMDRLQILTERMDLLYDTLPPVRKITLFELMTEIRGWFVSSFPCCDLVLDGPVEAVEIGLGSYLLTVLKELLLNAGEATADQRVKLKWSVGMNGAIGFEVINSLRESVPANINLSLPQPFVTSKSRHDGLGLAIIRRLGYAGDFNIELFADAKEFKAKVIL